MIARRHGWGALLAVVVLLLALVPATRPAYAATIVNSLDNAGPGNCTTVCTLRDAIAVTTPGGTIQFSVTGTIVLSSLLTLTKNVTIEGPGADLLIVDAQSSLRAFSVNSGVTASISGMTIRNANNTSFTGGAIENFGTLTLTSVVVRNSSAQLGGGIFNGGTLNVVGSTIRNNSASAMGSGIYSSGPMLSIFDSTLLENIGSASSSGGGITVAGGTATIIGSSFVANSAQNGGGLHTQSGTTSVTNSTFSGNSASANGGGIAQAGGGLTLRNATLASNSAGIASGGISNLGTVSARNTIIVGSTNGNCLFALDTNGNNLSDNDDCITHGILGDIVTGTPGLAPLALNAPGTTMTHALLPTSPAVDGVSFTPTDCGSIVTEDQRGVSRPQARSALARCDIGAFELESNTAPTVGDIHNQTIDEDTATPAIPFTVGDGETPAANLQVSATSNAPTLLSEGTIQLGGSGADRTIRLVPAANQFGAATIDVKVSDGVLESHRTFTLTVNSVNDAPDTTSDSYAVPSGQMLAVPAATGVLANDKDVEGSALTAALASNVRHGSLTLQPDGSFTYAPAPAFPGSDTFQYRASDGSATSPVETVTVTGTPINDAPVAKSDSYAVESGQVLAVPAAMGVLANDEDVDGPALSAVLVSDVRHGSLTLQPDGSFTYAPAPGFLGGDSFQYRASDGSATSAVETVSLTVVPPNCLPRSAVRTTTTIVAGRLQATIEALPSSKLPNNQLSSIAFGTIQNGRVTIGGKAVNSGDTYAPPTGTAQVVLQVERLTPGQPTTVQMTVQDGCGSWPSFVGGGPNAGF